MHTYIYIYTLPTYKYNAHTKAYWEVAKACAISKRSVYYKLPKSMLTAGLLHQWGRTTWQCPTGQCHPRTRR